MKVQPRQLSDRERIRFIDALYTATGSLRGRKEVKAFLHDLLTESERVMLGRRIVIAQMMLAGRRYDDIISELRVGADTVYRVHRWLDQQYPGYRKAVEGLEREWRGRRRGTSGLAAKLKEKYPLHFLLVPKQNSKPRGR